MKIAAKLNIKILSFLANLFSFQICVFLSNFEIHSLALKEFEKTFLFVEVTEKFYLLSPTWR